MEVCVKGETVITVHKYTFTTNLIENNYQNTEGRVHSDLKHGEANFLY